MSIEVKKTVYWCCSCGQMKEKSIGIIAKTDKIGEADIKSYSMMSLCDDCIDELMEKLRKAR